MLKKDIPGRIHGNDQAGHTVKKAPFPKVTFSNLYGSKFAHFEILLISVDEVPKPQLLGKSNLVTILKPSVVPKNDEFIL